MKKIYKSFFTLFLVVVMTTSPVMQTFAEPSVTEMSGSGKITTESLNVRSGPGKEYDAVGKVYSTDTVNITGSANGWYRIDYNGAEGYVAEKYVTMEQNLIVTSTAETQEAQPTTDSEETATGFPIEKYKLPLIILGVILLVVLIMFITLKGIRKMDDDEDDEYEDDDEYDDDEDDDEEEDDEYEYERVKQKQKVHSKGQKTQPVRKKTQPMYDVREERPSHKVQTIKVYEEPEYEPPRRKKELDLSLSNNPDDYRIDIDPIYFEEAKPKKTQPADTDADLAQAMKKMEELQREIERIKKQR